MVMGYAPLTNDIKDRYIYSPSPSSTIPNRDKSVTETVTKDSVLGWVRDTSGWWSTEELDRDLINRTSEGKANRRQILKRLKTEGVIEAHPRENRLFRYINVTVRLIDFKASTNRTPLAIKYPFGIESYFNTYPGNVIVVAGSPDAGKTAFLLNIIRLNMYDFSIFYQSSEMGQDELASRLEKFERYNGLPE